MIATRGSVQTAHSSGVRLSHFPIGAEARRVGLPQIRLVLFCVLVCRGYRSPCSDYSSCDKSRRRGSFTPDEAQYTSKPYFPHFRKSESGISAKISIVLSTN